VHAQIIDSESGEVLSESRRLAEPTAPGVEDPGEVQDLKLSIEYVGGVFSMESLSACCL
jgi:hypothetical protein